MTVLLDLTAAPSTSAPSTPPKITLITHAADPIELVICAATTCGTAAFADEADDLGARDADTGAWLCRDCLAVCSACGNAVPEDKADEHGFASDPETGEWTCEDCYHAPASPRLVGMVPC